MPNTSSHNEKLRAWWWRRQGLSPDSKFDSCASVLRQSGWARSVGGCGPYLTLFSRAGMSRETADQAVANLEIHELPSARGCTYVVPAEDFSLALHLAQHSGPGDMRAAEKLGVTQKEVDKVCDAVLAAVKKAPLTPDEIRRQSGNVIRSLGPEGQKKGISSTLPLALGQLQKAGEIRRISTNGRLDQQRYQYALWKPNPIGKEKLAPERAQAQLATRYFQWIAPARIADFQAFAGISGKAAKIAVEALKLEPLSKDDDLLILPSLRSEFESFRPPKDPCYHLVTALDSLILLNPADLAHSRSAGTVMDLPSPAIIDRGRVVGLWEYDPEAQSIAYSASLNKDALLKKAVADTENYIRTQLGDARTFSLDSPKSRKPRIEALRR